jgi:hypothetical protein
MVAGTSMTMDQQKDTETMNRFLEKLTIWFVWNVLPEYVVYWAMMRVAAHATTGKWDHQIVPDLTWAQMADRWYHK